MRLKTTGLILSTLIAIACALWLSGNPTFKLFFAWPNGGTWSNTIAWLEDAFFAALFMFVFRDHLGRRMARWWERHHGPHLEAKLKTQLDEHLNGQLQVKLAEHHDQIQAKLDDHKEQIAQLVTASPATGEEPRGSGGGPGVCPSCGRA